MPVRRMIDILPETPEQMLGAFDRIHKKIFIAEEVWSLGQWRKNTDLMFELRHEFGHALNALTTTDGEYLSNESLFVKAFKEDFDKLSQFEIADMKLFTTQRTTKEQIRDEIFADMYAHSTGITTSNPGSLKMKRAFPACLRLMKGTPQND